MGRTFLSRKLRIRALIRIFSGFFILVFAGLMLFSAPRPAQATCNPCTLCPNNDCTAASQAVTAIHEAFRPLVNMTISMSFFQHRNWFANDFYIDTVVPALQNMTEQLSAVAMHQVMAIGMFLDAKQHLETQRLLQQLQAQAHKDYQPSQDFCWFGTNVRSMAATEQTGWMNTMALNTRQLGRQLGNVNMGGSVSREQDRKSRWMQFISTYCDPQDNNWYEDEPTSGLVLACGAGGGASKRINMDIDYTRLIEEPRSLDVNFMPSAYPASPATPDADATADEEDVLALGNNLYGHNTLRHDINAAYLKNEQYQHLYLALRSVAAKRSVAENSFNAIVGLKSSGPAEPLPAGAGPPTTPRTREFLAAVLTELGMPAAEAFAILGENPSYYAQLEILAKKIYQNPDFYANLYDTPANVQRKSVSLKAIELMLDRAIFESQLRQEMAMSVLLSSRLRNTFRDVNKDLPDSGR